VAGSHKKFASVENQVRRFHKAKDNTVARKQNKIGKNFDSYRFSDPDSTVEFDDDGSEDMDFQF